MKDSIVSYQMILKELNMNGEACLSIINMKVYFNNTYNTNLK